MTVGVRQIMSELCIINEAELFCSDLEFKDSEDSITRRYLMHGADNSQDLRHKCNDMLNDLIRYIKEDKLKPVTEKVAYQEKLPLL